MHTASSAQENAREGDIVRTPRNRRGSDRRAEMRARHRIGKGIAKLKHDVTELAGLIRSDQKLVHRIEHSDARVERLSQSPLPPDMDKAHALAEYHAGLSRLEYILNEAERVLSQFEQLDSKPRMTPVIDIADATTKEYITSLIDGAQFQILTRSLSAYDLSPDDYRRLFGLPDDYLLWTEKLKRARSKIIKDNRVWDKRGLHDHSGDQTDLNEPPKKRG